MKAKLKPPAAKRLKVNRDMLLSTSALKFNLRRYTSARKVAMHAVAGAYTRPLVSST
jgi:hypothetical protein